MVNGAGGALERSCGVRADSEGIVRSKNAIV
jgi:hypothetical protein